MRAAVVGHIEWMEFVPVERVPRAGEIVGAAESWTQAAGGGAVAAVQFSKLADSVALWRVCSRTCGWRSSCMSCRMMLVVSSPDDRPSIAATEAPREGEGRSRGPACAAGAG